MPPRIRLQSRNPWRQVFSSYFRPQRCRYASAAAVTATTPAPPIEQTIHAVSPIRRYPPTQPPSHKPPEFRKSQLHRQYASMLRSSPLVLIFQHNNLLATEWAAVRRELAKALRKVDADLLDSGREADAIADSVKFQVVQTGILAAALRVVGFFNPELQPEATVRGASDPAVASSTEIADTLNDPSDPHFRHGLSQHARDAAKKAKRQHGLEPLLSGPLALLTFPDVSPQHLKAALTVVSPGPDFPAPKRRVDPDYHEPAVQLGLQKLMLLGARVEGKVFDNMGARWVGSIDGGMDGLRAQLVAMLSGIGASITHTLESASRNLYFTVESRRMAMEEEESKDKSEA